MQKVSENFAEYLRDHSPPILNATSVWNRPNS